MFDVTLVSKIDLCIAKSGDAQKFRSSFQIACESAKADAKAICKKLTDPVWQEFYAAKGFAAGPDKITLDFFGNLRIVKEDGNTFVQSTKSFDGVTVKVKTQVEGADDIWALCPKVHTRLRDNHGTLYADYA
jgi:hypothetical protein